MNQGCNRGVMGVTAGYVDSDTRDDVANENTHVVSVRRGNGAREVSTVRV